MNTFGCTNTVRTISRPTATSPSLPQWSSQDNRESVSNLRCHIITIIKFYWLKGKSYWIYYVLCRRLAERKPVLWYRDSRLYLFLNNGVHESPTNISSTLFRARVWTLVDVDSDQLFPPVLSQQGTNNLIVFATSPKKERWASLEKTTTWDVAIMNPWTRGEISEALAHSLLSSMFKLTIFLNLALLFMDLQATTQT